MESQEQNQQVKEEREEIIDNSGQANDFSDDANFFNLEKQKKDSTVSLSENDANSPRVPTVLQVTEKQTSANISKPKASSGFDFENKCEE